MKYILLIGFIYFITNKISPENIPLKSPTQFTILAAIVLYILDSPNIMNESFDNTILNTTPDTSIDTNVVSNTPMKNDPDMMKTGLPTINKVIEDTVKETKSESCDCEKVANKAITRFLQNRRMLDKNGMLHYADAYIGDMGYSDIKLDHYIPLGASGNGVYNTWELAEFNMLNTDRWKPPLKNTRECKNGDIPQPQPLNSDTALSLLNWDYSRKVLPPDSINIDYINNKFNKQ